jgi:hypothetical protein
MKHEFSTRFEVMMTESDFNTATTDMKEAKDKISEIKLLKKWVNIPSGFEGQHGLVKAQVEDISRNINSLMDKLATIGRLPMKPNRRSGYLKPPFETKKVDCDVILTQNLETLSSIKHGLFLALAGARGYDSGDDDAIFYIMLTLGLSATGDISSQARHMLDSLHHFAMACTTNHLSGELLAHQQCEALPPRALSGYVFDKCECWSNQSASLCQIMLHSKNRLMSRIQTEYSLVTALVLSIVNFLLILVWGGYTKIMHRQRASLTTQLQFGGSNRSLVQNFDMRGGNYRDRFLEIEEDLASTTVSDRKLPVHDSIGRRMNNLAVKFE